MVTLPSWLVATPIVLQTTDPVGGNSSTELVFMPTSEGFAGTFGAGGQPSGTLLGLSCADHPEGGVVVTFTWRTHGVNGIAMAHAWLEKDEVECRVLYRCVSESGRWIGESSARPSEARPFRGTSRPYGGLGGPA